MSAPNHQPDRPARSARNAALAALFGLVALVSLGSCGSSGHSRATPPTASHSSVDATTTPTSSAPTSPSGSAASRSTTTTVQGPSGPPAGYPAAQPTPPPLAGAFPTGSTVNLITVVKTLTTYEDWVWSHPNPALVANYDLPIGTDYAGEVRNISAFHRLGLHANPTPTEIDFIKVVTSARPQAPLPNGKPRQLHGYQWFVGGVVTVIDNLRPIPMLRTDGTISGQQFNPSHTGRTALSVSVVQGQDGQFRFADTSELNPPGGIAALEQN